MMMSNTDKELQTVVDTNFSTLLDRGVTKPSTSISLDDKMEIVQAVALHYVILWSKAELDQFAEGLASCGILMAIMLHKEFFHEGRPQLTPGDLQKINLIRGYIYPVYVV